jgi:lysophospholipase L1-like esterase
MSTNVTRQRTLRTAAAVLLVLLAVVLAGCSATGEDPASGSSSKDSSDAAGSDGSDGSDGSATPAEVTTYVALGDSYTSAPLVPVTDVANGCFRSSGNYPTLVAEAIGSRLEDRSCGGADTTSFTRPQRAGIPAQRTALRSGTDLVTIGFGGNDGAVFGTLINRCPALRTQDPSGAPCEAAMATGGKDTMLTRLARTERRLTAVAEQVHRLSPKAKVLLVGYPQIVDADDVCSKLPLAKGDYAYAERVNRALTEAVEGAAKASGSTYVDVWAASQGHDVCSDDPWINGTVNDQRRAARFHPFAVEQQAVAKLVEKAASD